MKDSTEDRAAGKAREVKGKIKKNAGRVMDRPDIAEKGREEEIEGKTRRKIGEVEKVFGH